MSETLTMWRLRTDFKRGPVWSSWTVSDVPKCWQEHPGLEVLEVAPVSNLMSVQIIAEGNALTIEVLKHEAQRLRQERDRLREAIAWACGDGNSDFFSEAEREERGLPRYWWRTELERRAGLPDEAELTLHSKLLAEKLAEVQAERDRLIELGEDLAVAVGWWSRESPDGDWDGRITNALLDAREGWRDYLQSIRADEGDQDEH